MKKRIGTDCAIADMKFDNLAEYLEWALDANMRDIAQAPKAQGRLYRVMTRDNKIRKIPFDEIILFKSSDARRRLVEVHLKSEEVMEIRGQVSRIAPGIPEFFQCHTSVVVNVNHVREVIEESRKLILTNGHAVPIAARKIPILSRLITAHSILW